MELRLYSPQDEGRHNQQKSLSNGKLRSSCPDFHGARLWCRYLSGCIFLQTSGGLNAAQVGSPQLQHQSQCPSWTTTHVGMNVICNRPAAVNIQMSWLGICAHIHTTWARETQPVASSYTWRILLEARNATFDQAEAVVLLSCCCQE